MNSPEAITPAQERLSGTTPPIYFAGGHKYDQVRNGIVLDCIQGLGYPVVSPLADPVRDPYSSSHDFTIRWATGHESPAGLLQAYRLAPKRFVTAITSWYQEERAQELIDHLESQGRKKINGIFQSADAQNGLLAALERPDLFANLVLAFPSGLVKKEKMTEDQRRILKTMVSGKRMTDKSSRADSFEPKETWRKAFIEKRRDKSGGSAVAASTAVAYQGALLSELRAKDNTPGVALVLGLKDTLFTPDRVISSLGCPAHDVDCILVTDTAHGMKGNREVMDKTLQLFSVMDEVKEKRRAGKDVNPLAERIFFTDGVGESDRERILDLVKKRQDEVFQQPALGTLSISVPGLLHS
jgi:hypothetical protein